MEGMSKKTQEEIATGQCNHLDTEEVKNCNEITIAIRCRGCTKILAQVGICDSCGRMRKLTHIVVKRKKRYCNVDCLKAQREREKPVEAKEKKAKS